MNLKQMKVGQTHKVKAAAHPKDNLLRGFTYEELITAVQSNEKEITAQTVEKVYKEMLDANIADAKTDLHSNMKWIIKEASFGK